MPSVYVPSSNRAGLTPSARARRMIVDSFGSRKPRSIRETSVLCMPERSLTCIWLSFRLARRHDVTREDSYAVRTHCRASRLRARMNRRPSRAAVNVRAVVARLLPLAQAVSRGAESRASVLQALSQLEPRHR